MQQLQYFYQQFSLSFITRIKSHLCSTSCLLKAEASAYQPGCFFYSDSLRSQASEKAIPSSLLAIL